MSQPTNRVVFPKPAGAETSVSLRSSPWSSASCRRERATRFGRVLGARSLVVTSVWGTAAAPARLSLNISLLRGSGAAKPRFFAVINPPLNLLADAATYTQGVFCLLAANRGSEKIMTEKESFTDKVRDHATDDGSPHAHQAPDRS